MRFTLTSAEEARSRDGEPGRDIAWCGGQASTWSLAARLGGPGRLDGPSGPGGDAENVYDSLMKPNCPTELELPVPSHVPVYSNSPSGNLSPPPSRLSK